MPTSRQSALPPQPTSEQKWIDPQTGRPTETFLKYMRVLDILIRSLALEIP